jgi:hypothetical protein
MAGQDLARAAVAAVERIARELGAEAVPPGADLARQVELAARAEAAGRSVVHARMACPATRSALCWTSPCSRPAAGHP